MLHFTAWWHTVIECHQGSQIMMCQSCRVTQTHAKTFCWCHCTVQSSSFPQSPSRPRRFVAPKGFSPSDTGVIGKSSTRFPLNAKSGVPCAARSPLRSDFELEIASRRRQEVLASWKKFLSSSENNFFSINYLLSVTYLKLVPS